MDDTESFYIITFLCTLICYENDQISTNYPTQKNKSLATRILFITLFSVDTTSFIVKSKYVHIVIF